jgi:hypothetical protein
MFFRIGTVTAIAFVAMSADDLPADHRFELLPAPPAFRS